PEGGGGSSAFRPGHLLLLSEPTSTGAKILDRWVPHRVLIDPRSLRMRARRVSLNAWTAQRNSGPEGCRGGASLRSACPVTARVAGDGSLVLLRERRLDGHGLVAVGSRDRLVG